MQSDDRATNEPNAFRAAVDHGLWDVYLGLLLLAISLSAVLNDLGKGDFSIEMMLGIVLLYYIGRKYIIDPRLRKVRSSARRKVSLQVVTLLVALALLAGLIIWFFTTNAMQLPLGAVLPVLVFVILAIIGFGTAAYMLDIKRLYLYGFLFALSFATLELIDIEVIHAVPGIVSGVVIMTIGLILMVQFLRSTPYPAIPEEEPHDQ